MSNSARSTRPESLLAFLGVVLVASQAIHGGFSDERSRKAILALMLSFSGLVSLFPLAAFGPRSEQHAAARVSLAAVGSAQIFLALAAVSPNDLLRGSLTAVAGLFVVAALFRIPRRWFRDGTSPRAG